MPLKVRSMGGDMLCTVSLTSELTVQDLKTKIHAEAMIPRCEQALHVGSLRLKGDAAISDCSEESPADLLNPEGFAKQLGFVSFGRRSNTLHLNRSHPSEDPYCNMLEGFQEWSKLS